MTRGPYDPNHPKIRRVEVYWTAVTYKTVMVYGALLLAVVLGVFYLFVPQWYSAAVHKLSNAVGDSDAEKGALSQNQAHFVNLDGKVQVKKVNSVQWVNVDYHTTLDRKSTRLNSSHGYISYAVFCLKKKKNKKYTSI